MPYTDEDLAPGYCMAKVPLLGSILLLATDGGLDLDAPVRKYTNLPFLSSESSLADVLEHRAGLVSPDLLTWRMLSADERDMCIPRSPQQPTDGYSDLLANLAMVAVIESVASASVLDFLHESIFVPADAVGHLQYGADSPDVNPAVAGLPHTVVPLASERLDDQIAAVTPATGVFATAKGLSLLLEWLFLTGDGADRRLATVLSRQNEPRWDPVLDRPASYSAGFMSELGMHGVSDDAFGHTAAMASWLALVDPEDGSVVVGYSNGVPLSEQDAWEGRNLLLAALRSDSDRIPAPTSTERPVLDVGDPMRTPPLDAFAEFTDGPAVLPQQCSLTVEVQLTDVDQGAVLIFENGRIESVTHTVPGTWADVALSTTWAVLAQWLTKPDVRLGSLIQSGEVQVNGQVWYLSALEYWAAHQRSPANMASLSKTAPAEPI